MRDMLPEDDDKRLEFMFRELSAPIADDGFTRKVMGHVTRKAFRRAVVLTLAGAIGAAVAAGPLLQVLNLAGHEVSATAGRWHELAWLFDKPVLAGIAFIALVAPAAWRWLEE
jgi:hypothetical protein